jgi:hypothetical protein
MTDDTGEIVPFRPRLVPKPAKKVVQSTDIHCIGFQGTDDRSWYTDDPDVIYAIFQLLEKEGFDLYRG